jgi:hypothetical protein
MNEVRRIAAATDEHPLMLTFFSTASRTTTTASATRQAMRCCSASVMHWPTPGGPSEPTRTSLIGERILAAAPALGTAARLVRSTHEAWDGSGYPDGIAAEEIPLGSRIISVCDAFRAMTSRRPYAVQKTPDEALAELRHCSGSQFDASIVEVLERVLADRVQSPLAPAAA